MSLVQTASKDRLSSHVPTPPEPGLVEVIPFGGVSFPPCQRRPTSSELPQTFSRPTQGLSLLVLGENCSVSSITTGLGVREAGDIKK